MNPPPIIEAPQTTTHRYSLTRGDLFRWNFYLLLRNRLLYFIVAITAAFLIWDGVRDPQAAHHTIVVKIVYSVFMIATVLVVFVALMLLTIASSVLFKKFEGVLGEHELEIRPDGLLERTAFNESLHKWSGSQKIIVTSRHLYLYVTDNNVHIVPRRSFSSLAAETSFRTQLAQRMQAAILPMTPPQSSQR